MSQRRARAWRKKHGVLRKRVGLVVPAQAYNGMVLLAAVNPLGCNRATARRRKSISDNESKERMKQGRMAAKKKQKNRKASKLVKFMRRILRRKN